MAYLVDANVLLRGIQPHHPLHAEAVHALAALRERGEELLLVPQTSPWSPPDPWATCLWSLQIRGE